MESNQVLANKLLSSIKNQDMSFDLTLNAPIFDIVHPRLMKKKLDLSNNPEQEAEKITIQGWNYACFPSLRDAKSAYPEVSNNIKGYPAQVYKSLSLKTTIIDFEELGAVVISSEDLDSSSTPGEHQHLLPIWLNYALSQELWGPQGKWIRFHDVLHKIFSIKNLLAGQDSPGFYPLKPDAIKLERFGFKGSLVNGSYILNLPWTFPLTALRKLENIIGEEF